MRIPLFLAAICFLVWITHYSAPSDMIDDDQLKPVAYTLDIVVNGNWAVQSDYENSVASKPPLYQWTCAILGILRGKVDELTMYLPTGLSILITVLLCSRIATERFGSIAGLWTGLSFLLCSLTAKHVCLARTDAMFTMWVSAAAFTGLRAWERGGTRQWTLFWVFAALATLTKGPLGLVIASLGLAAHFPERKETSGSHFRGSHLIGISLFILLCGGWFAWAVLVDGERVIDKMIGRELIGHAVASEAGHAPLTRPYQPLLYFLVRFAPWCVPALSGLYFAFRTPAADPAQRRLERFCACWLALGLIMFGIAGHQRADLLLPLFPAAAILAGRRLARWKDLLGSEACADHRLHGDRRRSLRHLVVQPPHPIGRPGSQTESGRGGGREHMERRLGFDDLYRERCISSVLVRTEVPAGDDLRGGVGVAIRPFTNRDHGRRRSTFA